MPPNDETTEAPVIDCAKDGANQAATLGIGLVVGNGFTIDMFTQLGFKGLDIFAPLDWMKEWPSDPPIAIVNALPAFSTAMDALRDGQVHESL